MLFFEFLLSHTTEKEVFEQLQGFWGGFNGLERVKCVGICTDGASAMVEVHKGVWVQACSTTCVMR